MREPCAHSIDWRQGEQATNGVEYLKFLRCTAKLDDGAVQLARRGMTAVALVRHINMSRYSRFSLLLSSGLAIIVLSGIVYAEPETTLPQTTLQILPASPRYQEPVYARIKAWYRCTYGAAVSMSGTNITIETDYIIDICYYPYDVELGRFPAGDYTVELLDPIGPPLTTSFTVGPRKPQSLYAGTLPAVNYSGMWWNALESGWGLSVSQGPTNQLFAVWFVYDLAGMPTWYTLEMGGWTGTSVQTGYSGFIFRYTGPYLATAFDQTKVQGTMVGTGTLTFSSANTGRFEYVIAGIRGFKDIARLPID